MADYSIWVVQYAQVKEFPVGGVLYGQHNAGHLVLPYCYAVVRDGEHTVLVDTGYADANYTKALATQYGVTDWQSPEVVLGRLNLSPEEVDTVVLTHNHFDHAGNVDAFPNARVYIQSREISNFVEGRALPDKFSFLTIACDPDLLLSLVARMKAGLLTVLDGPEEILPGIRVTPAIETHTAGSQYVTVDNAGDGRWVLPGDNVYVYENLEGMNGDGHYVPIGLANGSIDRCVRLMDEIYASVGWETTRVLPFHELRLWERFPSHRYEDGLHVAEVSLAPGQKSLLPA